MSDEQKKVELSEEDLEKIAGGLAENEGCYYKCVYCCENILVHSNKEISTHKATCKWNPKNMK